MSFSLIQQAVAKQFQTMTATGLFRLGIDKEALWQRYLDSFPAGTNPVYRERTEHDCCCCRHFVKTLGGAVSIVNGTLATIWDIHVEGFYQTVADRVAEFVRAHAIDNIFLHPERTVGMSSSRQLLEDKSVKTWDHFFVNLPSAVVVPGPQIGPKLADARATHDVMLRSLGSITLDSVDTVLELIEQNSLYRGEEHRFAVAEFRKLLVGFQRAEQSDLFVWSMIHSAPASVTRIRNTAIGTLLTDLTEGKELEDAVKAFEAMVAPTNYKRPTALVTKAMVQKARLTVDELGLTTALERRYATLDDISVNDILFADRSAKREMSVFDEIASSRPENTKKLDRVEEIAIDNFLASVLPKAESLEVMAENRHAGNLVSLIAPVDPTAKALFKWPNNFSWSYAGDVADSIKERVKKAGGNVTGDFRASLSWFNHDDLDLHLIEPSGNRIYYGNKRSATGGNLDVDMNAGGGTTRTPVENIVFPRRTQMTEGVYQLSVNSFCRRESTDIGFEVEVEFEGTVYSFAYDKPVKDSETIHVCEFKYDRQRGLQILKSLPSSQTSKTIWGIPTQTFAKVRVVMLSPNQWGSVAVGNKHYFFMLDGCRNEDKARGFFNEFLHESLAPHRKVLEVVGARMKTDLSDRQLSGLGFSSTQRNSLLCRVQGSFTRTVKINF
jgi:hypothetical protein